MKVDIENLISNMYNHPSKSTKDSDSLLKINEEIESLKLSKEMVSQKIYQLKSLIESMKASSKVTQKVENTRYNCTNFIINSKKIVKC
jgi:hypothetical protein